MTPPSVVALHPEPPSDPEGDRYMVPGLERGLRVLEQFGSARRHLSLAQIARALDVPRSSAFRIIHTLERMGYLERDEGGRGYHLGTRILSLGFEYLASLDVVDVARPELELMRDTTGASAHLAVREGRDILYLSRVPTRHHLTSNVTIGARRPAHATPMGRLLLSELALDELMALYADHPLQPYTDLTPRTVRELYALAHADLARGYVVSRGSFEAGGSSIAAPVFGPNGRVIAAIDISGPDAAFNLAELDTLLKDEVTAAAARISSRLGYRARSGR